MDLYFWFNSTTFGKLSSNDVGLKNLYKLGMEVTQLGCWLVNYSV